MEKQKMSVGCAATLLYIIGCGIILGGFFCLPWGIILIAIGIIWILGSRNAAKKTKKEQQKALEIEAERQKQLQIIKENTNEELCEKTLSVIANKEPITTLDNDYQNLTILQRECTLDKVFENIVKNGIEDGEITDEEESAINTFSEHFGIVKANYETKDWYEKYIKLLTIKDILNGIVPQRRVVTIGQYFLNLAKEEKLIWRFDNVEFLEEVKKTHYEGASSGVSIRIAKGVYYRVGAVKGTPVTTTELKQKAVGTLFVATKHLYFYSEKKSVKIPFVKVVSFTSYTDGLGVQKDGVTAKPQAFRNLDGWFIFNLVSNINNLN